MQPIPKKVRKMSMTTFEALTPEAQRLYDFDNFHDFLAPETSDHRNTLTVATVRQRKMSTRDMLETIQERQKSRKRLYNKSVKGTKTQRSHIIEEEKPNYSETYSNFLSNHFKKQNSRKTESYHPDRFFDESMLNKLQVRNLPGCLQKRCRIQPKSKFEDYRMKDNAQVKNYYDELNSRMIKRSSHSQLKNRNSNEQNEQDLSQGFVLFRKTLSGLVDNLKKMEIEEDKQKRMLNRFFQSHLLVKNKLSQPKKKFKTNRL